MRASPTPPALALFPVLCLVWLVLSPGLSGNFLFDDYPNLQPIADLGGVDDLESFQAFVGGGFAGPTGRPVALLSFLLDSPVWPASPYPFKRTNLLFHLLNGCLLIWASLQLCRFYGIPEKQAQYLALFGGAAWLLHPYLLSTTFYIVQRMAQLAALFCFAGITAYLHGRRLSREEPARGLAWMVGGLGIGTFLGALSKENGALLPLLVLAIECCRPRASAPPPWWFRWLFLYAPSVGILAYLASTLDLSHNPWPHRNFNQPERLLTEARILWEYLGNLLMPRIEGAGLYQDGRAVSQGLTDPPSTLAAITGLAALLWAALVLRRRTPLMSLAILFFLGGHLLESSLLGLELYFEHRNYLPSAFLFLGLGDGLRRLSQHLSPQLGVLLAAGFLAILAFLSYQRASLWGDGQRLDLYWAVAAPDSPRAQSTLATRFAQQGQYAQALQTLNVALAKHPNNPLLTIQLLLTKTQSGQVTQNDFLLCQKKLLTQPLDAQALAGLRRLVEVSIPQNQARTWLPTASLSLIGKLSESPRTPRWVRQVLPYLKGRIYLSLHDWNEAEQQFLSALEQQANADSGMRMVGEMAGAGQYDRALKILEKTEDVLQHQSERRLRFSRHFYQSEIERIRRILSQKVMDKESGCEAMVKPC